MGGAGIQNLGVWILNERNRFPGRLVGQAQEHHIRLVEQAGARFRILAQGRVYGQHLDIRPGQQPLMDHKTGGALLPVYKNRYAHFASPRSKIVILYDEIEFYAIWIGKY